MTDKLGVKKQFEIRESQITIPKTDHLLIIVYTMKFFYPQQECLKLIIVNVDCIQKNISD